MAEVASAYVSILPSAKGFGRSLDSQISGDVTSSGKRLGSSWGKVFGIAAGLGIGVKAVQFLGDSLGEAREAQKVGAQTNAVIKATGGAANISAKQVGNLAGALSAKTGIDDEVIQSGSNMLLTFKNIRNEAGKGNDVFNQSTTVLTDMATAMGTEPKQAAIQLGKALNDPIKGISALSRVGVTFTDGQKKQIETLVKSGKTMDAQKIILKELTSEFGGSAEAQATAGDKAKVAWGNFQEAIGTAILPLWDKILAGGTKAMLFLTDGLGPAIGKVGEFFGAVKGTVGEFFDSFSSGSAGGGLLDSLKSIASAVQANFLPVLKAAANVVTTVVLPAIVGIGKYLAANLIPIFTKVGTIISTQVVPIVASLARFLYGTLYPAMLRVAMAVGERLKPILDQLFETIQTSVLPTVKKLLDKFREWQPTIQKVVLVVVKIIGKILEFAAAVLAKVLPVVIRLAGLLLRTLVPVITTVIGWIAKIIGKVIQFAAALGRAAGKVAEFVGDVKGKFGDMLSFIGGIPGKITALGGRFLDAGRAIIGKFVDGLKNAGGVVSGIAGNVWDAVKSLLNSAIAKINSALEFTINLPGPDIHVNPGNIPYLATGTRNFSGGWAVVGEEGPELVHLPGGSDVFSHGESVGVANGVPGGASAALLEEMKAANRELRRLLHATVETGPTKTGLVVAQALDAGTDLARRRS